MDLQKPKKKKDIIFKMIVGAAIFSVSSFLVMKQQNKTKKKILSVDENLKHIKEKKRFSVKAFFKKIIKNIFS